MINNEATATSLKLTETQKPDIQRKAIRLGQSLRLPCGAILKNRLLKSAMSDSLADGKGNATLEQARLYERWAEGGVALSIIGEVQVDPRYPEKPGNLVLGPNTNRQALSELAARGSINDTHIWPQIGHAGALAAPLISQPKGPSALRVGSFSCAGMSLSEIQQLPAVYTNAALLTKAVGFSGLQLHAGHGFLLSQFLSPLFNRRQDQYGGSVDARARVIVDIIEKVRGAVGPHFPIGIKINSSDQLEGGLSQQEALEVIGILDRTSIDLIEISGGTYFPGATSSSDAATDGPYFIDFASQAKQLTKIPIVTTGGFKNRPQAVAALGSGETDMIGMARALALNPSLARQWLKPTADEVHFPRFNTTPPGGITAWYTMRLTALAKDNEDNFSMDLESAIRCYEQRDQLRAERWRRRFSSSQ
ncbi:oxidoreductase [Motiliproteus coralliicola]|uniref:Oxidoreductase n=1 Tax=Motiliproteus coralliicola TaxID=2283196 RepID=A0A369WUD4_9GAMM|nr:oxidoreductase [Motiliproteus coralliicola]RDE25221.1 oxidoreductase [Motiliproteus coralliicola]